MKNISKLIFPFLIISLFGLVYYNYFVYYKSPEHRGHRYELGDFSKFNSGTEISQEIIVAVVKSKSIERDASERIISFYAKDKDNVEMKIKMHEAVSDDIVNAEVIELMGHLHEKTFVTSRATVIK